MLTSSEQLDTTLRRWSEVFMQRSMRDFAAFMRSAGLSMPQVNTLYRLSYRGACGVGDIADETGISNAAASQMIERLVQQGLVERSEDPTDRRAKQLRMTPAGLALMHEGAEQRLRWMAELSKSLSEEEQAAVTTALSTLIRATEHLSA
ncbi:MAG: MarR family transcriptional regulator [Caldilineales bacterium]